MGNVIIIIEIAKNNPTDHCWGLPDLLVLNFVPKVFFIITFIKNKVTPFSALGESGI